MAAPLSLFTPETGAIFSPCGRYRYLLWRRWAMGSALVFVMLNPSTANAFDDDPTIRRCVAFAKAGAWSAIEVVNLFAWRETDPKRLGRVDNPIGPDNDHTILATARRAGQIVVAWGARGSLHGRDRAVLRLLRAGGRTVHALGVTKDRHPSHPLYLRSAAVPVPYFGGAP